MSLLPVYGLGEDPGANFSELLRRAGVVPFAPGSVPQDLVPHATTCVAVNFSGGVVVAGDRRATAGNWISHREMEKVVEADRHSAVAISGAAGPAMEMIKLFQVQLEHFEKMEGRPLSLEGKANQLSMMLRNNLPAAMQGMVVIPLFAGFDTSDGRGRLWDFDVTGGRYEEREHVAIGSGGMLAGTVVKVGWKPSLSEVQGIDLVCRALWQAAEGDAATGGPDALRGVYPIVLVIDSQGVRRLDDATLAQVFAGIEREAGAR